ncbi:hypothetical protein SYNPS1DRAFT_29452 [Syncephalis pseudoplumigaleata]|uniref:TRP C-terminal domain-containing protein n=1 Tax=Syncephalis pseudoplumigaleata TaxID=1712513 RepID=A0A4V1J1E7_9FUNG|nr:hypothetical protein SYNPS1DRAFT_29452 [Syncephalis pseudoplumigaleata]|eukprot:RKP24799.1 hypothetical protein SYNPS1DRAFT_29452 [Syncephalis pseudoplumigaleata]
MQSFDKLESVATLGAACDLFSKCPDNVGPAVHKGPWSLQKDHISLPTPVPWIDYNITFRMPFEAGRGNYVCATIPITQALADYNRLPGRITAALPPLALAAGLLDSYLSPDHSMLTFFMGDGSAFRLPGFFDLWEHAQWVAMTGMLGAHYTRPYEAFASGFGWSFFNWGIPFIDAMAGDSVAQPGPLVPSSSVITSSASNTAKPASQDAAATHHLVARQQLPACSPSNPGPAGVCSDPSHCCSSSGYCGAGPTYCGEGSGPAAKDKSPASSPPVAAPSTTTTTDKADTADDHAKAMSDEDAQAYSRSRSGITAYANYVGVATDRLVHVTFYTFVLALLVCLVASAVVIFVYEQVRKYRGVSSKTWPSIAVVTDGAIGVVLRLTILGFLPLLLTSIHHLALPSTMQFGAGGIVIASLMVMVLLCSPVYLLFLIFTRHSPTALFDSSAYLLRLGPLYSTFVAGRIKYVVVPIVRRLVYAIIIGAGQSSGVGQLACLIVVEIGFVLLEMWLVPRSSAFGNQLAASTGMLRTIGWLFIIPLLPHLSLGEGKRQAAAFAFIIFQLLLLLLWLVLIVRSFVYILLRYRSQQLFNAPGTAASRQRPAIRHPLHQHDHEGGGGSGADGASEGAAAGTGNLGSPMTVGDFEFIVRDGGDSFDRYHPPNARFSAMPRASTLSLDSTPPMRPRRQSDADFLRSSTPTTADALIAPSRGYITDGTANSSLRSYPDPAEHIATGGDIALDDDVHSQGDELFYYGGGEIPNAIEEANAAGAASANRPRLIPAFLRQHDAQDSSGDELGSPAQATFPRYMTRAEPQNHRV